MAYVWEIPYLWDTCKWDNVRSGEYIYITVYINNYVYVMCAYDACILLMLPAKNNNNDNKDITFPATKGILLI